MTNKWLVINNYADPVVEIYSIPGNFNEEVENVDSFILSVIGLKKEEYSWIILDFPNIVFSDYSNLSITKKYCND